MKIPVIQMPEYRSHKKVWALKIATSTLTDINGADATEGTAVGVKLTFEDERFAPFAASVVGRPIPEPGWYYVRYEDGYHSYSPAEAFEKGYTQI